MQTVAIVGLGALGVLFAEELSPHLAPEHLRIVADRQRIARYERDGVYANGTRLVLNYVDAQDTVTPADVVIFAVKFGGLPEAIEAARQQVGEHTLILSALNGIASEELLSEAFGRDKVLYCVAQGMDAVKVGNQLTYSTRGFLRIGEQTAGAVTPRVEALAEFLLAHGMPCQVSPDMPHHLWGKLMLNVGVNQAVAVFEGNYGTIQQPGRPREIMIAAMREVMTLAPFEQVTLTEDDLTYWLSVLDTLGASGKPSLRQDLEAGRSTEVALFAGTLRQLGQKHGVPTPVNDWLYAEIKRLENAGH